MNLNEARISINGEPKTIEKHQAERSMKYGAA